MNLYKLFHKKDVETLGKFGKLLDSEFSNPKVEVINPQPFDNSNSIYTYEFSFPESEITYLILQEDITKSQRVENFTVMVEQQGKLNEIYSGTVIGYKKIVKFAEKVETSKVQVRITHCRCEPQLLKVAII